MFTKMIASLPVIGLTTLIALGQPPKKDDKPPMDKPGDKAPAKPASDKPADKTPKKPAIDPTTRDERLDAVEPTPQEIRAFGKLVQGHEDPNTPEAKLMDKFAKWMTYRLTWTEIHDGRLPSMPKVRQEISDTFPLIPKEKPDDPDGIQRYNNKKAYVVAWRKSLTGYLRDVMKSKYIIARVNAVQIMQRFAELGQEEIADELLPILENGQEHDAVKHWVFLAYNDVFTHMVRDSAAVAKDAKRQERLTKAAQAVLLWLDAKSRIPADSLSTLSPPELDAIIFIRRSAARALSALHRPMIVDNKNVQEGNVAAVLLRIMVNEKGAVLPEPNWAERVEAAFALCTMQSKASPTYQPDVVAYHVGRFLAALGAAASEDDTRAGGGDRARERWRYYAGHLKAGIETLKADAAGTPMAGYVSAVATKTEPLFNFLYDPLKNPESVQDLNDYLNGRPPKGTELFKAAAPAGTGGN